MMLFLSLVVIVFLCCNCPPLEAASCGGGGRNRRRRLRMGFLPKSFSSAHIALLVVLVALCFSALPA